MGIPSYFSYIIKNYSGIIRKLNQCSSFQHVFMDCNSIVYSSYANITNKESNGTTTASAVTNKNVNIHVLEQKIINDVIMQIKNYIKTISPSKSIFIAFDGVAPFAKMNQQRVRRYKHDFMAKHNLMFSKTPSLWDTTSITPGTLFMEKMNAKIKSEFHGKMKEYGVENLWVSCSDEIGEGEHKLFAKIRELGDYFKHDQIAVYGLDSDLIMLSIFHLKYCEKIQVFREAPEFKTILSRDFSSKNRDLLFMNMGELSTAIACEMHLSTKQQLSTVYDYIFMCFFLGNDFMPHFPAFNIRTHGVQILNDTYRNVIGIHTNKSLINHITGKIDWNCVSEFVKALAKQEHGHFTAEMATRNLTDNRNWLANTPEEQEQIIHNLPVIYRGDEKYICISESGWETRYYKTLFEGLEPTEENIKRICVNYLEGLEWVMHYYTHQCVDWRWKYKYHYPPLMKDLAKYVDSEGPKIIWKMNPAVSPSTQLAYVLPRNKLDFCRNKKILLKEFDDFYPENYTFQWSFCRYFWEAHPVLPELPIEELEQVCDSIIVNCSTAN